MLIPPDRETGHPMVQLHCGLRRFFALSALAGHAVVGAAHASPANVGWDLEKDVETPTYAEPASTDVNIDSIVLSCEQGPGRTGLQLRLYLAESGPLAPRGAGALKDHPALEFAVDGVRHTAQLIFADGFVIVADTADGVVPLLSDALIRALQYGRRMELRFDLVREAPGLAPSFDGSAVVDLQAGRGGAAVAAVRRCAGYPGRQVAETAHKER
jgi:hypothetical protein